MSYVIQVHCHTGFGGLSNVWPIVSIFKAPQKKHPKQRLGVDISQIDNQTVGGSPKKGSDIPQHIG
jgi:hypothetical protein